MSDRMARHFPATKKNIPILQGIVLLVYVLLRVSTTLSSIAAPRALADTDIYLRISREAILGSGFLAVKRPFVFPFLLQLVHQDFTAAAVIQLSLSILAWGWLALVVSGSLRPAWLKLTSFSILLALSLVRHLAGWDFVMMTESLSLSTFVLVMAAGARLLRGWRTDQAIVLCGAAFLFAFTRDTNAFLLAMFAGLLLIAVLLRWAAPKALMISGFFALVFFLSNSSADTSQRWVFPLVNVIGKRILPYSASTQRLAACGMPVTPKLLSLADTFANGQDRAFFNDPELEGFRAWVQEQGKSCYARWLLEDPVGRTVEVLSESDGLIYFEDIAWYFSRRYSDLLPSRLERLLYPVHRVTWLWAGLTAAAFVAVLKRAWRDNVLWALFIMLCLTILPHLFITWHGDAMAPERHAISVGLQLSVSFWLFIVLALEKLHNFIHKDAIRT